MHVFRDHPFDSVESVASSKPRSMDIRKMNTVGQQGVRDTGSYKMNTTRLKQSQLLAIPERDMYAVN